MAKLQSLNELLDPQGEGPYVSLYQPTHRQHPDNKQDPILFRNLVKQAEEALGSQYSKDIVENVLAPFHLLAADTAFWNFTADGIAVFGADGFFRVMSLQRPTTQLLVAADSFHIKPLLRVVQSADRFHVLSLSRDEVRLFEGNRDGLGAVQLDPAMPATASDVVGEDLGGPERRVHGQGQGVSSAAGRSPEGPKTGGIRYSHGSKSEVIDQQAERFFRAVDRGIIENYSKPSGLPLILAALPEHHTQFRAVSHNAQLLEAGVEINPESLSMDQLRAHVWKVMEPIYLQRLAGFVDQFGAARNAQQGSADLSDVARAAAAGRVRVLLLEADRQIPGRIDSKTGALHPNEQEPATVDDMLDDLAEQVLRTGGEVIMVPAQRMPETTGLAAIYRF